MAKTTWSHTWGVLSHEHHYNRVQLFPRKTNAKAISDETKSRALSLTIQSNHVFIYLLNISRIPRLAQNQYKWFRLETLFYFKEHRPFIIYPFCIT